MTTFDIKLTLAGMKPPMIWRTLRVPGRYRLDQVHRMIQILFGWDDGHLHEFVFGSDYYTDLEAFDPWDNRHEDTRVSLEQALGSLKSFHYRYDFGDGWRVQGKVVKRHQEDTDAPTCLAGEFAGPPEDCGGISGYFRLLYALENPDSGKYDWVLGDIPKGWHPDKFSVESVNKKLARAYRGRKTPRAKASPESVVAGFRLSKLGVGQAVVAVLMENSPRTFEQVHERLEQLEYPLPKGLESLRRGVAKTRGLRVRLDGALELEPGAGLEDTQSDMKYRSLERSPQPTPAPPAEEPPLKEGPVSWEEVESARPHGLFPPQFSLRRKLILAADAEGGVSSLESVVRALQRVEQRIQPDLLNDSQKTLNGCRAVELHEGTLSLQAGHEETLKARAVFRKWLNPYQRQALETWPDPDEFRRKRALEVQEQRARCSKLRPAVLAVYHDNSSFALSLFDGSGAVTDCFDDAESALERLDGFDLICGLDPRTTFEKLGWPCGDKLMLDLTPPFKSRSLGGNRRQSIDLAEAIHMTTGTTQSQPKQIKALLDRGRLADVRKALDSDVRNLYLYWRFGVIHGVVIRDGEGLPVTWNVLKEIPFWKACTWCIEDRLPLQMTTCDGHTGDFLPEAVASFETPYGSEDAVTGRWSNSKKTETYAPADVLDLVYPYPVPLERLEAVCWQI